MLKALFRSHVRPGHLVRPGPDADAAPVARPVPGADQGPLGGLRPRRQSPRQDPEDAELMEAIRAIRRGADWGTTYSASNPGPTARRPVTTTPTRPELPEVPTQAAPRGGIRRTGAAEGGPTSPAVSSAGTARRDTPLDATALALVQRDLVLTPKFSQELHVPWRPVPAGAPTGLLWQKISQQQKADMMELFRELDDPVGQARWTVAQEEGTPSAMYLLEDHLSQHYVVDHLNKLWPRPEREAPRGVAYLGILQPETDPSTPVQPTGGIDIRRDSDAESSQFSLPRGGASPARVGEIHSGSDAGSSLFSLPLDGRSMERVEPWNTPESQARLDEEFQALYTGLASPLHLASASTRKQHDLLQAQIEAHVDAHQGSSRSPATRDRRKRGISHALDHVKRPLAWLARRLGGGS